MKNEIKVKGEIKVLLNGKIVREVKNLVVDYGTALLANLLYGNTANLPGYIAVGTDSTTPANTQTALVAEIIRATASKNLGTAGDANKVTFSKYWSPGDIVATVNEAGIFDAATSGNMFNRAIFADVTVTAIDTFAVVWQISFSAV